MEGKEVEVSVFLLREPALQGLLYREKSPYSQRSVLELNCAFLDQARVMLEQHPLDSALEPWAEAQPTLGGLIVARGSGQCWMGQHQAPGTGLGCSASELRLSLAPF